MTARPLRAAENLPCDGLLPAGASEIRLPCGCYLARVAQPPCGVTPSPCGVAEPPGGTDADAFVLSFCGLHAMAEDAFAVLARLVEWERRLMPGRGPEDVFSARAWTDARRLMATVIPPRRAARLERRRRDGAAKPPCRAEHAPIPVKGGEDV